MMIYLEKLWNKLEIRVLVISSLSIQILLFFLAGYRKHVLSVRFASTTNRYCWGPLAHMFHWLLWLAFLLADYVATLGLAYLRESDDRKTPHLHVFWAPFFLLHLGGQDTITALSIEDNELWSRHLLTLFSQATLALYSYFMLNLHVSELWPPAVLMFIVGCFKYIERIWALQRASMSALRSSMITKPNPGPNYAKFIQEYTSAKAAGLLAIIQIRPERHSMMNTKKDVESEEGMEIREVVDYKEIVCKAYEFFPTFKRLFVDLILSYKNREDSHKYFRILKAKDAYELIEIELNWMYDMLHSKASVIYTIQYYGWVSRATTLIITTATLILFATSDHTGYQQSDVILTYMLLLAAVGMEIIAFAYMLLSLWTYAVMKAFRVCNGIADFLFSVHVKLRPREKLKWSDKMAQFSLITYALEDKPRWWKPMIEGIGFKNTWDNYRYTTLVTVSRDLKDLVYEELKKKMANAKGRPVRYWRYSEDRGQWALKQKGYYEKFGWSMEGEFDESILLWHIATDLLFDDPDIVHSSSRRRIISQHISKYMMFLIINRPFMMPAGIGQIRFGDTSAEAKSFLQSDEIINNRVEAVRMILEVSTEFDPAEIKGDISKSVFFRGCKLAHELKEEFVEKGMITWNVISMVWVEMLCYAAIKCSGQFHSRQLSKGGELLTVIWYLMAHLGMSEQYRIEEGHARAKLLVSK